MVLIVCFVNFLVLSSFGPSAAPSAPKDFMVLEVTRHHVHLSWEAPEHDGGSPLTGYQVEKRDVSRKTWVKVHHQPATVLVYFINDLNKCFAFKVTFL